MVKETDFKFDEHKSRDNPDVTPYKISEMGRIPCRVSWPPKTHLVDICTLWAL